MQGEGASYPHPLLRLRRGALVVVEMEARHRRCCSLAVVEAGDVVLERERITEQFFVTILELYYSGMGPNWIAKGKG
jgi:hypothetical protein